MRTAKLSVIRREIISRFTGKWLVDREKTGTPRNGLILEE